MRLKKEKLETLIGIGISECLPTGMGSFAQTYRVKDLSGREYQAKYFDPKDSTMLESEADSLQALHQSKAVRVPRVFGRTDNILITEWIEQDKPNKAFFQKMGTALAELHKVRDPLCGFPSNNHIGATPQINLPRKKSWVDFFISHRLDFQMELLGQKGLADSRLQSGYLRLREKIPDILAGSEEPPSLLHGDLWSGNYLCARGGEPVFIDPACYFGHREMDLAMTRLFGGFPKEFYEAYQKRHPLPPNHESRTGLYTLYHLFNHLNLFGKTYYAGCLSAIRSYLTNFND